MIGGGFEIDGNPISEVKPEEVAEVVKKLIHHAKYTELDSVNIVISGIFSPANGAQEDQVEE